MLGERRKGPRRRVGAGGIMYDENGIRIGSCRLRDISSAGAQIELLRKVELPKTFVLALSPNSEVRRRCAIAWQSPTVVGVRFCERFDAIVEKESE
jgi:hypothetical protein